MGLSLPGSRLICLSRDNLSPESFERIIRPFAAWSHVVQDYQFSDRGHHPRYIVNIEPISSHPLAAAFSRKGKRAKEQLKAMIECGEVVCLNDISVLPAGLFYIDGDGALICRNESAFRFGGAKRIITAFNLAVSQRDYRHCGGKPAPTSSRQLRTTGSQPVAYETLNSKNVGRLLAAGGIYNGNVEGFRQAAEQLGGDAPVGYEQVMNNKGLIIAGASVAAGLGLGRMGATSEIEQLEKLARKETLSANGKEFTLDALSQSGGRIDPAVKSGNYTVAGRALQKHGSREGSSFPMARGTPAQMNEQGQKILDSIIRPSDITVKEGNRFGGFDVISPNGQGSRFDSDGNFRGFLEP